MGLSNELSCEAGSFSHHCNTHRFLWPEDLRCYFPGLEPWVVLFMFSLRCSSCYLNTNVRLPGLPQLSHPPCVAVTSYYRFLPPWLPDLATPTSLNECSFFKSVVVGLPYSLIFWQFWLFFVFKFVFVLLCLCEQAKSITYSCILAGS